MNQYIISIVGVIFLTTIAGIILPEGKLGQYIKSIFSILAILVILTPIINFTSKDFSYENLFNESEVVCQHNFFDYIYNLKVENLKKNIDVLLKDKGYDKVAVDVLYEIEDNEFKIKKILVNFKNLVIIDGKEHININEEIKQAIADYVMIDKKLVIINE